jgi:hypothetical protein
MIIVKSSQNIVPIYRVQINNMEYDSNIMNYIYDFSLNSYEIGSDGTELKGFSCHFKGTRRHWMPGVS